MSDFYRPTQLPIGFEDWSPKARQQLVADEVHRLLDAVGYFDKKPESKQDRQDAVKDHDKAEATRIAAEITARLDRSDKGKDDGEE
ncbi:hypothetical protein QTI24_26665 [Variovorax sp. J22P240]|uniref:hypothetical protein n=1 Tax=Variovorax sp. J22P240 TaxID=3053514 RepID=UPI002575FDD5|nr:hypothetical protein [Variovorax sp. J22P240]MDM0002216.1 hypothetical protein [Variovorax sp. J22P240]